MKLQILIPRYNEPEKVIRQLLDSISIQQNVDFDEVGVIICDDGSDNNLPNDLSESYPYDIQYFTVSHKGVANARQACLDVARADYVCWCDADDMFYTPIGLLSIFRAIDEDGGFHMMTSKFVEETRQNGYPVYIEREDDSIFVHGKVFNRKWLIENNIFWDTSLNIHEDSYFVSLAKECCGNEYPDYRYYDIPFYLWRYSTTSISRSDEQSYFVRTMKDLIYSNAALIRELLNRDGQDRAYHYCGSLIFTVYYYMNTTTFLDEENREYTDEIISAFRDYYKEFGWLFESMNKQQKKELGQAVRDGVIDDPINQFYFEVYTLEQWLDQFKEK